MSALINERQTVETDAGPCEALSNHYKSVCRKENYIYPECDQKMPANSFSQLSVSEGDIVDALRSMNGDSSPGIDKIFPKFIKNISSFLVKPLRMLFRESLRSNMLPDDWITSIIVPVYKKNKKSSLCASSRPINLTSCVSKIFERVIHKKMLKYLVENNLISKSQHGFLTKRSTITNLLSCTFDWVNYFNNKQAIDIIYIDYEKAFDKVSHEKLLYKLKKLGFGGEFMKWIEVFIKKRKQYVRINNSYSKMQSFDSGVA